MSLLEITDGYSAENISIAITDFFLRRVPCEKWGSLTSDRPSESKNLCYWDVNQGRTMHVCVPELLSVCSVCEGGCSEDIAYVWQVQQWHIKAAVKSVWEQWGIQGHEPTHHSPFNMQLRCRRVERHCSHMNAFKIFLYNRLGSCWIDACTGIATCLYRILQLQSSLKVLKKTTWKSRPLCVFSCMF